MKKYLLLLSLLLIFNSISAQIKTGSDHTNNLEITYEVIFDSSKNKTEIADCISENDFLESMTNYITDRERIFLKGNYEYTYYINNTEILAGKISHDYLITVQNNKVYFRFFNFIHAEGNSKFNSIGILPFNFNNTVASVFTKDNYSEILYDLKFNVANQIRQLSKNCF
ncbi:hypothetical protein [Flavobacterium sp. J27]|uniref:hypothetical protein n=1 Tax=Flavobacterium sp. J27 TaxID=2060419 RepID=UPI00102FD300|nr:hypothetical protein [Flavobacterium sp. J27]